MTETPRRYLDDPDAHLVYPITDANDEPIDWATPTVSATKSGVVVTIACTWLGTAAPTRSLKVPLDALPAGTHTLRLLVPNENDIRLGTVTLA